MGTNPRNGIVLHSSAHHRATQRDGSKDVAMMMSFRSGIALFSAVRSSGENASMMRTTFLVRRGSADTKGRDGHL